MYNYSGVNYIILFKIKLYLNEPFFSSGFQSG